MYKLRAGRFPHRLRGTQSRVLGVGARLAGVPSFPASLESGLAGDVGRKLQSEVRRCSERERGS